MLAAVSATTAAAPAAAIEAATPSELADSVATDNMLLAIPAASVGVTVVPLMTELMASEAAA